MSDQDKHKRGLNVLHLLCLLFIHHKLSGTIDWSWWWVLSPAIFLALFISLDMWVESVRAKK